MYMYMCMRISVNHNSLGCKQPSGLDVNQSLNVQDAFRPILGLISCMYIYIHALVTSSLHRLSHYIYNESTKVQTLGVFLGIDRSMSWKQRCYVSVSYVSM